MISPVANAPLVVLSHMRSRSSVLCHVLGSHPEVLGYSELRIRQGDWRQKLPTKLAQEFGSKAVAEARWHVDKILHWSAPLAAANKKDVFFLFLLRKPEATLRSIVHMCRRPGAVVKLDTPERAFQYYAERLVELMRVASWGVKSCYVEAEALVERTDLTLANLTAWLGLTSSLRAEYEQFTNTGKPGFGDPMGQLAGGVVRPTPQIDDVAIPASILEIAEELHWACAQVLQRAAGSWTMTSFTQGEEQRDDRGVV